MTEEIWERHPVYPHEGSNLGRARSLRGTVLRQRPNNTPKDTPPGERYQLMDIWMPRPPCEQQENGRWIHRPAPACKCKETVSVHVFITECHWGLKKYRRQVARHRHGGSKADNSWENLLGWGFPSDNELDKPPEVRSAAARKAREAQIAAMPRRKRRRKWRRVTLLRITVSLPWARRKRTVTAGGKPVSKPVTRGVRDECR